jgi:hypothetical protein
MPKPEISAGALPSFLCQGLSLPSFILSRAGIRVRDLVLQCLKRTTGSLKRRALLPTLAKVTPATSSSELFNIPTLFEPLEARLKDEQYTEGKNTNLPVDRQ